MIKYVFLILPLFFYSIISFSQENILNKMQGLSLKGDMAFAIENYTMTIKKEKLPLNNKGLQKIKKKYRLNNIESEYSDKTIKWENWVIENTIIYKDLPSITGHRKVYLLPETDDRMIVILLQSASGQNTSIEQAFMNAIFSRQLGQYITNSWVADKIDFAGREIILGDVCQWVSPQNVHCASFGQIAWSIFKNEREANLNTEINIAINKNSGRYKILKEENIDVKFENIPTIAKRVTYKIKTSKFLSGGRNKIVVYYITQKVRDQFLSCVLTQYLEVNNDYSLPILLKEVMSIE